MTSVTILEQKKDKEEKKIRITGFEQLSKDVKSLLNNDKNSDISITVIGDVGKKEKPKKFYAHKLILASRCKYFKNLIDEKKDIVLKDVSQNTFPIVLQYLYTGYCQVKQDYMMELLEVSNQLELDDLHNDVTDYVLKSLTKETVVDLLMDVKSCKYKVNTKAFIGKIIHFVEENDIDLFQNKNFMKFDEEILMSLLKSSKITGDEVEIFNAIVKWGKANKGVKSLKDVLAPLLVHIRFPLMNINDLMDNVKPNDFVPLEYYLLGLEYNIVPDGPFDSTDVRFKQRSTLNRIFLNALGQHRVNFKFSNKQQTVEKIGGGNNWSGSQIIGNKGFSSGLWYWEVTIDRLNVDRSGMVIGITKDKKGSSSYKSDIAIGMSGNRFNVFSSQNMSARCAQGDRIGIMLDFKQGRIFFFRNGSDMGNCGNIFGGSEYFPVIHMYYEKDKVSIRLLTDETKFPVVKF